MLRIAICDDDIRFTSKLEDILIQESRKKGIKSEIDVFFDGEGLVNSISNGEHYEIILLDIEMEKMDGITTAKNIRSIDKTALIIYISGYDEYLKELFEVEPFRFISKPLNVNKFKEYCASAIKRVEEQSENFEFSFNRENKRVLLNDIVYFESVGRTIKIHMCNGNEELYYGKMNKIEKELQNCRNHFIRIHQSFLINYAYIKKMTFSEIVIAFNETELVMGISEDRRPFVRKNICEIAGGNLIVG